MPFGNHNTANTNASTAEQYRILQLKYLERAAGVTAGADRWVHEPLTGSRDFYFVTMTMRCPWAGVDEEGHALILRVNTAGMDSDEPTYEHILLMPDGSSYTVTMADQDAKQSRPVGMGLNSRSLRDGQKYALHPILQETVGAGEVNGQPAVLDFQTYTDGGRANISVGRIPAKYAFMPAEIVVNIANLSNELLIEGRASAIQTLEHDLSTVPPHS